MSLSKKQRTVALLTCEAEYNHMKLAAKEIFCTEQAFLDAGTEDINGTAMRSKIRSAINAVGLERYRLARARYIEQPFHFTYNSKDKRTSNVFYTPSDRNDAGLFPILQKRNGGYLFLNLQT